jgi:dTMP kinase
MGISPGMQSGGFEAGAAIRAATSTAKKRGEHQFPGKLFVVEGIDGSGKSTQLSLLHKWLESRGYGVVFSEWNSSPLVKDTTKLGKKKKLLTPATFSLIHSTDFADRTERSILPLLKAGAVVLCDQPTVAFYFRVPLETAIGRLLDARDGFKFYEAGMDLGLSDDAEESFRLFQGRIIDEYEKMIPEFELTVIDATLPIEIQQTRVRQIVKSHISDAAELRMQP